MRPPRARAPRSSTGRRRSSLNSLRHGGLSRQLLLDGEDPQELERLTHRLRAELEPEGELDAALVGEVVGAVWRLRRARRTELGVFRAYNEDPSAPAGLARAVARDIAHGGTFRLLLRYQAALNRQLMRCLHELERRRAARSGTVQGAPLVVDVDVDAGSLELGVVERD